MLDKFEVTAKTKMLGFPITGPKLELVGGPFREIMTRKNSDVSVCLKEEARKDEVDAATFHIPIQDFSVPTEKMKEMVDTAVIGMIRAAMDGKSVMIGCMGGTGRTGLVLAVMAKALGVKDPVEYVRANYRSHAVETTKQEQYVAKYDVSEIRRAIRWPIVMKKLRLS